MAKPPRSRIQTVLRRLPKLARAVRYYLSWKRRGDVRLVETTVGPLYVDAADFSLGRQLLDTASYESQWTAWMKGAVQSGMCAVDVGANIGYYSILLGRAVGSTGRVLSFEPEPYNYSILSRNVRHNDLDGRVTPVPAALADKPGKSQLFMDRRFFGVHSLSGENRISGGRQSVVDVDVVTLDDAVEAHGLTDRVNFLKIDAQGAEGMILAGATRLLAQPHLTLLMEIWPHGLRNCGSSIDGVFGVLTAAGMTPHQVNKKSPTLKPITWEEARGRAARATGKWSSFNLVFVK